MRCVAVAARVCMGVVVCLLVGCKQEPAIVIKFDANDLAGQAPKLIDMASRAPDLASAPDLAPAAAGAASGEHKCKKTSDCEAVPVDCCPCSSGGAVHAIAKKGADAVAEAAREKRCKGTMCPMHVSNDPSCGKSVACVAGACVLVGDKPAP